MKTKVLWLLLLAFGLTYYFYLSNEKRGAQVGQKAPDFSISDQTKIISLHDYRGHVVLLNFWATWCPPCVQEIPSLQSLHLMKSGPQFTVLAVSVDEGGWKSIDEFRKKVSMTMPVLADPKGDVANLYGTYQLPETYLIDKEGNIVKKYVGPENWTDAGIVKDIEAYVQK